MTSNERSPQPPAAKFADFLLGLSVLALAFTAGAWMASGGFEGRVLGLSVSACTLKRPLLFAIACFFLWVILHPTAWHSYAERLQNAPHVAIAWGLGTVATIFLCGLKMWQHYALFTTTYDLAEYTNVAWNLAHGYGFWDSLQQRCYLGDHFSPIFLLLAPLVSWADSGVPLLLLQCLGLGLAAVALYLLCLRHLPQKWLASVFVVFMLLNPYLNEVSRYDFHPAAFAIPLFLWMLYFADTERYGAVLLLSATALLIEETLVPALAGVGLYIALFRRGRRTLGCLLFVVATAWFVAALTTWMPLFLGENRLTHINRYTNLGNSLPQIMHNLVWHPWVLPRELLLPFDKTQSLNSLLLSVGYLPLLAGAAALPVVLPLLMVGSSCSWHQYHYINQYSATILPFLFYAAVMGSKRARVWPALVVVLLYYNVWNMPSYMDKWSTSHLAATYQLMAEVPREVDLCSTQFFLPHLCTRHNISQLGDPVGECPPWTQAPYVLLEAPNQSKIEFYPLTPSEYLEQYAELYTSHDYEVIDEKQGIVLLRRRPLHAWHPR